MRPPVKRHGGKAYLARWIVSQMPEHRVFVEPFVGGGSVLLNKPKSELEIAGDLDAGLINLWSYIRTPGSPLIGMLSDVEYSQARFDAACEADPKQPGVYGAICYLVRNRFSRGGLGKTFAWSDRLRGGQPGDANAWETIKAELPSIAERVNVVQFNHVTAFTLIPMYDSPDTLFYLDPPYLHETRTARKAYEHEMDREAHVQLLEMIRSCTGKVMLSGYRSPLYDEALADWDMVAIDLPNHSGQGKAKQRRTECLWSNRPFTEAR